MYANIYIRILNLICGSIICLFFTLFAYANESFHKIYYEQCTKPIHEYYDLKGGDDKLIEHRAHETPATLCASLEGVTFEINSTAWGEEFFYLSLVLVQDFDGDGWEEAIVKLSTRLRCIWYD